LIDYPERVTWTLGASADFFNGEFFQRDQLNPKLGVAWHPTSTTTVRATTFRTLHRSLVSSQTIEPTQVAGFNQLFDGLEGEEAWRFGIAADQKITSNLYGGLEISSRTLKVPIHIIPSNGSSRYVSRFMRKEQLRRAYLFWTPQAGLGLTAEYLFEYFDRREATGSENILELRTHRVPLGIGYFDASGWYVRARGMLVDQSGEFDATPTFEGKDRFWVVDGSIGYRLPGRYGLISLVAKNLFDRRFRFQDTDPSRPLLQSERSVFLRLTLAF
jgi:outer membrane receptor protein involved in Fe transport